MHASEIANAFSQRHRVTVRARQKVQAGLHDQAAIIDGRHRLVIEPALACVADDAAHDGAGKVHAARLPQMFADHAFPAKIDIRERAVHHHSGSVGFLRAHLAGKGT
jgi:hypothetical protein